MAALQTANASLLWAAPGAIQVQPRTARNVVLGVVLGLMLGIALAFALDAMDTRVRSSRRSPPDSSCPCSRGSQRRRR